MAAPAQSRFVSQLKRYYALYTGGFIGFVVSLSILEQMGVPNKILGYIFLGVTALLYAGIGILSRTSDVAEYYVAGRRVPAFFNGMAVGADWMSAASFIGLAGTLYLSGYDGLAFVLGWTGGFVLVALLLAPYLRKFGQFTIPDFLGARYGGSIPRTIGVFAAILCSFTYVIAQIYGVGLITSRFTGLDFGVGVFVGLGSILVCSFLGGMRAVTWTQVSQYVILIVAYMIPVIWLSMKHTGNPVPQVAYGYVLQKVTAREQVLNDPTTPDGAREAEVRAIFKQREKSAEDELKALDAGGGSYLAKEKEQLVKAAAELKARHDSDPKALAAADRAVADWPPDVATAHRKWRQEAETDKAKSGPIIAHAEPFAGPDEKTRDNKRKNFMALVLCLMVGTAALPHILMRFYTTTSVKEARKSVFWSLFFISLLYITAPALAVLAKYDVYTLLVGSSFSELPSWVSAWASVDKSLMSVTDVNHDGIVQLAEVTIGGDLIVLATPEIAGLPYVVTALVAAGGLAAALSTADGLMLTISNSLSHDVYYKMIDPKAPTGRRLFISKALLLGVAVFAAYITSLKPGHILFLVCAAFSLAASAFFPALALGVFWKRANKTGAILGMVGGLFTCMFYMYITYPFFGVNAPLWWDINPISAGVFGMAVGFVGVIVGSLLTAAPDKQVQDMVDHVRYPNLERDVKTN
ncbi:sodium:solute symporter family protein [Sideroxydans lithotrophicus]|uniref:Putative sodium symporter protein n=1 Tax=Sideroxydans lithotrophicus (strain ES-1) TaxID=580332 RepID=D5CMP3_SIDLE|nr:sodium:solute symporter family protein [Sideroxydans lithotrophicus]ADE12715.1 putative sodium symporter protein [Sideroxydans lithotrophicus ES-1]